MSLTHCWSERIAARAARWDTAVTPDTMCSISFSISSIKGLGAVT